MTATDPGVSAASQPRLSRQCQLILDRLRQGPATNHELAGLALKYTSRLSDLRKAGYSVTCVAHNRVTGVATYELTPEPFSPTES